jgi:SSS family solute:Na+ symporter
MLPPWFAGFGSAAIVIGALVPAAIMSIAAANLFTRNIYREYINPQCTDRQESTNAKVVSLVIKLGALAFVLGLPNIEYAINFQLLAGGWILQTFPTIIFGLYTRWFHRRALLAGWLVGMAVATYMPVTNNYHPVYALALGPVVLRWYVAFLALVANLIVTVGLTVLLDALKVTRGADLTQPSDYAEAA